MHRSPRPPGGDDCWPDEANLDLQPAAATQIDSWLSDADIDLEDDRLQRLGGDEELLLTLQLSGYSKDVWDPVAQELARYGLAVITAWSRSRTIFSKVKQRTGYGLPVLDEWPDNPDVVNDVVTDTVVAALAYFKEHVLMAGRWDSTKGASIRTYFIGQCLFKFANCYRKAYDREIARRRREVLTDDNTVAERATPSLESGAVTSMEARSALERLTSTNAKLALMLLSQGYSYEEIAARLGFRGDVKKVENMISYQRRLMRSAR